MELNLDLLRTLVAIQESGGFSRAAARLGRTQSAISLQVRRLESAAGTRLFQRQGKASVLTGQGAVLLHYARRLLTLEQEAIGALDAHAGAGPVRIGCSQDFAESWLPPVLAQFTRAHPGAQLEARVDRNQALVQGVGAGELDVALTLDFGRVTTTDVLGALPVGWIAARGHGLVPGEPLPLALLAPPCGFRDRALTALDRAGVPWRIVFTSASLPGLWSAVSAGLGMTVRTPVGLPAGLWVLQPSRRLPALGHTDVALRRRAGDLSPAAQALAELLREEVVRRFPWRSGRSRSPQGNRERASRRGLGNG